MAVGSQESWRAGPADRMHLWSKQAGRGTLKKVGNRGTRQTLRCGKEPALYTTHKGHPSMGSHCTRWHRPGLKSEGSSNLVSRVDTEKKVGHVMSCSSFCEDATELDRSGDVEQNWRGQGPGLE